MSSKNRNNWGLHCSKCVNLNRIKIRFFCVPPPRWSPFSFKHCKPCTVATLNGIKRNKMLPLDIRTRSSTLLGWQSFKIYNKWTQLKSKMTIIVVRIGPTLFLTSLGQKSEICALWAMKTAKEATTKLQFEGTIRKEALIRILNPRIFLFISVKPFLAFPPLPSSLLGKIIVGRAPHSW